MCECVLACVCVYHHCQIKTYIKWIQYHIEKTIKCSKFNCVCFYIERKEKEKKRKESSSQVYVNMRRYYPHMILVIFMHNFHLRCCQQQIENGNEKERKPNDVQSLSGGTIQVNHIV